MKEIMPSSTAKPHAYSMSPRDEFTGHATRDALGITPMHRRDFLRLAGLSLGVAAVPGSSIWRTALAAIPGQTGPGPYGPLLPADGNGIMLPAGFTSRVVARGGETVGTTGYVWPVFPDGGAVFPTTRGSWIYVANSEFLPPTG